MHAGVNCVFNVCGFAHSCGCMVKKCFVIYSVFYQTWIKKKNRHVKHSRPRNDEVPATKWVKLTPWQAYMKDFGKIDGTFANYSLQFRGKRFNGRLPAMHTSP